MECLNVGKEIVERLSDISFSIKKESVKKTPCAIPNISD